MHSHLQLANKSKKPNRPPNSPAVSNPKPDVNPAGSSVSPLNSRGSINLKDNRPSVVSAVRKASFNRDDRQTKTQSSSSINSESSSNRIMRRSSQDANLESSVKIRRSSLGKSNPPPKPKPPANHRNTFTASISNHSQPASPSSPSTSNPLSSKTAAPSATQSILGKFGKSSVVTKVDLKKTPQSGVKEETKKDSLAEPDFDSVKIDSVKLAHPTAARAKAPKRRPPSSNFRNVVSYSMIHSARSTVPPEAITILT